MNMIYGSNLPDDWGCYFTVCSVGHRYHMSEGYCGACAEELGSEEERLWDALIARMSAPGFSVTDVLCLRNTYREPGLYTALFDKVDWGEHFVLIETAEPDGTDEIDLSINEWHAVCRTMKWAFCAREDWE
jgi:hypothetical protein